MPSYEFNFSKEQNLGSGRLMATIAGVRSTWTGSAWIAASGYAGFGTTGLISPVETTLDGKAVWGYAMDTGVTDALNVTLDVWQSGDIPVYADGSFVNSQTITWTGTEIFKGGISITPVQARIDDNGTPAEKNIAIAIGESRSFVFILLDSAGAALDEHADTFKLVVTTLSGTYLFQVSCTVSGSGNNYWTGTIVAADRSLTTETVLLFSLQNKTKLQRRVIGSLTVQPSSPAQ